MSRIGRLPVALPQGVTVTVGRAEIQVKGPKGSVTTPLPGTIDAAQVETLRPLITVRRFG